MLASAQVVVTLASAVAAMLHVCPTRRCVCPLLNVWAGVLRQHQCEQRQQPLAEALERGQLE